MQDKQCHRGPALRGNTVPIAGVCVIMRHGVGVNDNFLDKQDEEVAEQHDHVGRRFEGDVQLMDIEFGVAGAR